MSGLLLGGGIGFVTSQFGWMKEGKVRTIIVNVVSGKQVMIVSPDHDLSSHGFQTGMSIFSDQNVTERSYADVRLRHCICPQDSQASAIDASSDSVALGGS